MEVSTPRKRRRKGEDRRPGHVPPPKPSLAHLEMCARVLEERGRNGDEIEAGLDRRLAVAREEAAKKGPLVKPKRLRPDMAGKRMWMTADRIGARRIFETPEDMAASIQSYFDWCDQNPLYEIRVSLYLGEPVRVEIPKIRAMSVGALCLHIGLPRESWKRYGAYEGYQDLVSETEAAIYAQKFEGASAGLMSAPVIIRDLGLKDRSDLTSGDESVSGIVRRVIDSAVDRKQDGGQ